MRRWERRLTLAAIVALSLVTVSCVYFPARFPYALLSFGLSPPTPLICVKAAYLYRMWEKKNRIALEFMISRFFLNVLGFVIRSDTIRIIKDLDHAWHTCSGCDTEQTC